MALSSRSELLDLENTIFRYVIMLSHQVDIKHEKTTSFKGEEVIMDPGESWKPYDLLTRSIVERFQASLGSPRKRKRRERRLRPIDRLSAHDHLFTGESEGHEEPLEHVGTTRQDRGKEVENMRGKKFGQVWFGLEGDRWKTVEFSETIAISVCQKQVSKACREAFATIKTSLGRPACFRVSWIGLPRSPVKKAFANVRECPSLSRRLLECARSPCPRARVFASVGPTVNSDPGFDWVISVGDGGPK
ncbi:hypothetical protein CRG98_027005 [Punica granatum]|uniref:Uncharacterized protein n=1 Tax=Punica granatum TaxID=22663 RepID=A0A2I0J8L6_PUNGR|nr:hypothetical protein CRG98_027005 [Punica granatum]